MISSDFTFPRRKSNQNIFQKRLHFSKNLSETAIPLSIAPHWAVSNLLFQHFSLVVVPGLFCIFHKSLLEGFNEHWRPFKFSCRRCQPRPLCGCGLSLVAVGLLCSFLWVLGVPVWFTAFRRRRLGQEDREGNGQVGKTIRVCAFLSMFYCVPFNKLPR